MIGRGRCPAPTFVKVDIEGEEAELLRDAVEASGPETRLLVAVHSRRVDGECADVLRRAGYTVVESTALRRARAEGWRGDADLYCWGPGYAHGERDRQILERAGF